MFASLAMVMAWQGYRMPLTRDVNQTPPENFVLSLHKASGANLNSGSSTAHSKMALMRLFGDEMPPVQFGLATDEALMGQLVGPWVARITLKFDDRLPRHIRRWVGYNWVGGHAVALGDARRDATGEWEVFWMDPMGRPGTGYVGEWIKWDDVKANVGRSDGKVQVTIGEMDAAVPKPEPEPEPEPQPEGEMPIITHGVSDEYVRIEKGVPLLRPDNLQRVTTTTIAGDFRVVGRSEDKVYLAVLTRTTKVEGATGVTTLYVKAASAGTPFVKRMVPVEELTTATTALEAERAKVRELETDASLLARLKARLGL
jgi:hypothetical protein